MTGRTRRVGRGLVAAAFATFVAAFSHVVAGSGEAPGAAGLAVAFAFSMIVCVALAGRRMPLVGLVVSGISQLAFHLLFGLGAPIVGGADAAVGHGTGGGSHHGGGFDGGIVAVTTTPIGQLAAGASAAQVGQAAHAGHDGAAMWIAHALAAVVTVIALHRGTRTVHALGTLARTSTARLRTTRAVVAWLRLGTLAMRMGARVVGGAAARATPAGASGGPAPGRRASARRGARIALLHALHARADSRLRDLGVLFGALRHRGPPAASARLHSA